jgi:hypothetical protein
MKITFWKGKNMNSTNEPGSCISIGTGSTKGPSGPAPYCIAIGSGAVIDKQSYGEIQIATSKAKICLYVDGTLSVNGTIVGVSEKIYHCMRSLLGRPLPEKPNSQDIWEMFTMDVKPLEETMTTLHNNLAKRSDIIAIGCLAQPTEDSEIIFRNKFGNEFRIKPDGHVESEHGHLDKDSIIAGLRSLFRLA